jgi:endonuclease-3
LTDHYGARVYHQDAYDQDLTGALVATILSQHTSDLNSGRAYAALKAKFPGGWDDVRQATVEAIAGAIRQGGLADMKAPRIKNLLNEIHRRTGGADLDLLRGMNEADGMAYLTSFHGVGPKTAACVMMFNLGRPVIPVDTHVHRVSLRLGLVAPKTSPARTQEELLKLIGRNGAYAFHVHLIEHGRALCRAVGPKCPACPVAQGCDYFHERCDSSRAAARR